MLKWTPTSPSGAIREIASVTVAPQSPPCAAQRVYPSRSMSAVQADAIRPTFQPLSVGESENPNPGSDGMTMWKASSARPP